jgi:hypothetical protein
MLQWCDCWAEVVMALGAGSSWLCDSTFSIQAKYLESVFGVVLEVSPEFGTVIRGVWG